MRVPKPGEIWTHHKTKGEYEILFIGSMQMKIADLDMQPCVIYKALSDGSIWSRPLQDFIEMVDEKGTHRFSFIR